MAELKTRSNDGDVKAFIDSVSDDTRRRDCRKVASLMRKATGCRARMWGTSIVGFGSYRHRYRNGRVNEWMLTGFSPRKRNLAIYIMPGFADYRELMQKLGKHSTGKSCLYLRSLADVDTAVLQELIERSVADMTAMDLTGE